MSTEDQAGQGDGSVGRYVRERWGAAEPARPRRRSRRAEPGPDADRSAPAAEPGDAAGAPTTTRTPPGGNAWGADLPAVDDDLASEIDPQTPPHGLDLSALRGTRPRHGAPDDHDPGPAEDRDPAPPARDDGSSGLGPDSVVTRTGRAGSDPGGAGPLDTARDSDPAGAAGGPGPADTARGAGPGAAERVARSPRRSGASAARYPASTDGVPVAGGATASAEPAAAERQGEPAANGRRTAARTGYGVHTGDRADGTGTHVDDDRTVDHRGGGEVPVAVPSPSPAGDPDLPPPPVARPARPRWTAPDAVEAREAQRRRSEENGSGFDFESTQRNRVGKRPPRSGWRRVVYVLTRGYLNPGESPADIRRRELTARVNRPLLSSHKIAMLSLKGGVGKTTVTATLGATFASLRGDRVVAVDANPDRGTLSQKIPLETTATVRHLLRDAQRVRRYTDVRAYTSQGASRLEVLASEQDPAVSEAFSEEDYRSAVDLLEHFYNLVLTDCGTGLMHSAMYGVLGMADQLVIVSSGSIDGARSASATLDWLDAHGNGDLVRNAVVVINTVHRRGGSGVDLDRVAEHFAGRCRAVVRIPFDGHLEEGAEIDLERLDPATRNALLELAASVADGFPS